MRRGGTLFLRALVCEQSMGCPRVSPLRRDPVSSGLGLARAAPTSISTRTHGQAEREVDIPTSV